MSSSGRCRADRGEPLAQALCRSGHPGDSDCSGPARRRSAAVRRGCGSETEAEQTGPRRRRRSACRVHGADLAGYPGQVGQAGSREQDDLASGQRREHGRVGRVLALRAAAEPATARTEPSLTTCLTRGPDQGSGAPRSLPAGPAIWPAGRRCPTQFSADLAGNGQEMTCRHGHIVNNDGMNASYLPRPQHGPQ